MSALAGCLTFARLVDVAAGPPATTEVVVLRVGRFHRAMPMELRISPWWPSRRHTTLVELVPIRKVTPSVEYFKAGNQLLDEVVEELTVSRELTQAV